MSKEILYTRDLGKKELTFCKATLDDITVNIDCDRDRMFFAVKRDLAINAALLDVINAKLANPATPPSFINEPISFSVTVITMKSEKDQPILCKDGNAEDPRYNTKTGAVDVSLADKHYSRTTMEGTAHIKVTPLANGILELTSMKWEMPDPDTGKIHPPIKNWFVNFPKKDDKSDPNWLERPEAKEEWPARFIKDKDEDSDNDGEEIDDSDNESEDDFVDELD